MNSNTEEIGIIIRRKRLEKELSQQEFARQLHVSSATVSKWENGKHLPDPAKFIDISSVLECTIDELMGRERTSPGENTETLPQTVSESAMSPTALGTDIEGTDTAAPPQNPAPTPRSHCGISKRRAILLAVSALMAAFCFIAVSRYTRPHYNVIDSFHGNDSSVRQKHENAHYVIVEYAGVVEDEDIITHSNTLKDNYLDSCGEDVSTLIILYFQNYNPEQDYEDTADFVYTYYLKYPVETL